MEKLLITMLANDNFFIKHKQLSDQKTMSKLENAEHLEDLLHSSRGSQQCASIRTLMVAKLNFHAK